MKKMPFIFLMGAVCIQFGCHGLATKDQYSEHIAKKTEVSYLFDQTNRLKPEDIASKPLNAFVQLDIKNGDANLGYTNDTVWMRVSIPPFTKERAGEKITRYLIFFERSLNYVDLYTANDQGVLVSKVGGNGVAPGSRNVAAIFPTFSIPIDTGKVTTFYVRLHTTHFMDLNFSLLEHSACQTFLLFQQLFIGGILGTGFALLLYNFLSIFSYRINFYRYYVAYSAFMLISLAGFNGVLDYVSPEGFFRPLSEFGDLWAFLALLACCGLNIEFFSLKKTQPKVYWAFRVNQLLLLANIAWFYLGSRQQAGAASDLMVLTTMILATCSSLRASWNRFVPAYFFLAGVLSVTTGIFWYELIAYRVIPAPPDVFCFSLNIVSLAVIVDLSLLSMGILFYLKQKERTHQKTVAAHDQEMARADGMQSVLQHLVHDLANPMAVVIGVAEMEMKRCVDEPNLKDRWAMVLRAGRQNYEMLANVDIKAGMLKNKLEICEMRNILNDLTFTFSERLAQKRLSLVTDNFDGEARVFTNKSAFTHQVLGNLLSNCIKFSYPDAAIHLSTAVDGEKLRIIIEDHGIGIPVYERSLLFSNEPMESADGTCGEKGTGAGIKIVKRTIDGLGGSIHVESRHEVDHQSDHGTKFTVTINRYKPDSAN